MTEPIAVTKPDARRLRGKVVWITGASSGIGEALAHECACAGATLVLSARRIERLREVERRCTELGAEEVALLPMDQLQIEKIPGWVREAEARFGRIDLLINNAGMSQRARAVDTLPAAVRRIFELNFFSTVALTQEVLRGMRARGGGRICAVTSVAGKIGAPMRSAYSASKHALHGYFDTLRPELAGEKIGITLLVPGFVKTEISRAALRGDGSPLGAMDRDQETGIPVERCARQMMRAILSGRDEQVVAVDVRLRLSLVLKRLAPSLLGRLLRRYLQLQERR